MRVQILDEANEELWQAINFLDSQSSGLGDRFETAFWNAVEAICESPEAWPHVTKSTRRRLIRRFRYGIVYTLREDLVLIVAVMHLHRKPGYWRDRLP